MLYIHQYANLGINYNPFAITSSKNKNYKFYNIEPAESDTEFSCFFREIQL